MSRLTSALRAELSGFEEVPPILTRSTGTFQARFVDNGDALEYRLSFSDLSAPSTAAHIHFGQPRVNGGIIAFLCGGNGAPRCPVRGGSVTGRITRSDILGIPDQGVVSRDWEGFVRIVEAGVAYVNVHSTLFPAGEIRGQIRTL